MKDLPDCPCVAQCANGTSYNQNNPYPCGWRTRRKDGLFQCTNFKEKKLVTLDTLPEPREELFPDHDYE
jgi:hypothetical protein